MNLNAYCKPVRPLAICVWLCLGIPGLLVNTPASGATTEQASQGGIQIGIAPYLSPRNLIHAYTPLQQRLQQQTGRRVAIYSSSSFLQFLKCAQQGDYDLVIAPAHFARMLQKENRFVPVLKFSASNHALIVVPKNSAVHSLDILRQQTIAAPDKLSLASIVALTYLKQHGIDPDSGARILEVPSFASAILAVQNGQAKAAISASAVLDKMPPELRNAVIPLADAGPYANLVILASPDLPMHETELIRLSLQKHALEPAAYEKIISAIGLGELLVPTENELKQMDTYLPETRILLENGR